MATAKGGLTVAIKFTPQAQADTLTLSENSVGVGATQSTGDLDQMMQANDGGGAGAQIMGITSASVAQVQANLTGYVNLANFATPISTSVGFGDGGSLGSVSLDNAGNIVFTSSHDFNSLSEGESFDVGTFTYILRMGNGAFSVSTSTIKIVGTNDVPVAVADTDSGSENSVISGTLTDSASDVDHLDVLSYSVVGDAPAGFNLASDGTYTLDANDPAYQHLAAGASTDVVVTYQVSDGHGGVASSTLTITVNGVNDVATFDGDDAGAVTEDVDSSVSGTLVVHDVDDGQESIVAQDADGAYGSFSIGSDGAWTYTVDNDAIQALNTGDAPTETFTVSSLDGTTHDVVITVNGADEPAPPPPPPSLVLPTTYTGADPNDNDGLSTSPTGENWSLSNTHSPGVYGGPGDDHISGTSGDNTVWGGSGNDTINGNGDNDTLYGGSGADELDGGNADDILIGGYGADTITGGNGNDTIRYLSLLDTNDTIGGFASGDKIDLSAIDANTNTGANDVFGWGGQVAGPEVLANSVTWSTNGTDTVVYADTDGNTATAEFSVTLTGVASLQQTDFNTL